ncbi:MAG: KH domain-containing protein [Candidatus Aenigmatarchaeota archaeon]
MIFPICKVCLKNDILCEGCASKIGELGIKSDEIKTFRLLNKISNKYTILNDVKIERVLETPKMIFIITNKEDASKIIGKNGGMIKKIGEYLGKPIRVITNKKNVENFVKEIFRSNNIIGINILYGDEKIYRLRFPSYEKEELPIEIDKFSKFFNSIFGEKVEIIFE